MTRAELDDFLENLYAPAHERRQREQERQQQREHEHERRLTDYEAAQLRNEFHAAIAAERAYMEDELLPEVVGGLGKLVHNLIDERIGLLREGIETTVNNQRVDRTAQAANLLRLDLDSFRHELRRLAGMAEEGRAKGDKDDNVVVMPDFPGKREREA